MNKYTILLCRYTGKVGLVRKSLASKDKVQVCIDREPITYRPMLTRDTVTLGWVVADDIQSAFRKVPASFLELNNK